MTTHYQPKHVVDTHQHLWVRSERNYEWITPESGIIYNDFRPEDVIDDVNKAGITSTVLVQAADNYDDTFYMISVARRVPSITGVVGWVPFNKTDEAEAALKIFKHERIIKGFRNLTHNYEDPRWILRSDVTSTLETMTGLGFTLDMVSVNSDHNRAIEELAIRHPSLQIVVDHMSKPPIAGKGWSPWAEEIERLSKRQNVFCKISGLNTASSPDWTFKDWQPYVDHIARCFGSNRLMLGSDWPVSLLNGDFARVWQAQRDVISNFSTEQQDDIYFRSATRFYSLVNQG
jgi:L-fuconolactonase